MASNHVLRVNGAEEQTLLLEAGHETIRRILAEQHVTLIEIAETIDVTVQTIGNAFNKRHVLNQAYQARLASAYGVHVLDPFAKLSGARLVPLDAKGVRDILPILQRAALKVAETRDPESPGGERETPSERSGYLADLRAAVKEATALICQIEQELAA